MGLILFQLFTNFTIGSLVSFDNRLFRIEDITMVHPFSNRKSIFRSTISRPFYWILIIRNSNGGVHFIGHKVIKDPQKLQIFSWSDIPDGLK